MVNDKLIMLNPEMQVHNTLPNNLKEEDFHLFENAIEEKIPASYCWQLNNALLLKDTVLRNFRVWYNYSHLTPLNFKSRIKRLLLLFYKKRKIEKGVWITDNWSSGYFHWFADALTRLESVSTYLSGHVVLLPESYKSSGYICQSLELLNFSYIFLNDKVPNRVKDFFLPSHSALTGNFNPGIINTLREKFLSKDNLIKPFRKIYISRQNARARRLLNEEQLILELKKFDFEIHLFEDYTLKQQIAFMSECIILIGLHGAGLTNMLFMQPGTSVVELRKDDDSHNNCYFSMASALAINDYLPIKTFKLKPFRKYN